ncbi:MAG: hypothetical protein WC308_03640 [archaeon]|jgi:DNA-binding Lrp family transcriptional regulator
MIQKEPSLTVIEKRVLKAAYVNGVQHLKNRFYERVGLKKKTVDYVMKKLEEEGLYSGMVYKLNLSVFNSGKAAWIFITVNRITFDEGFFLKKIFEFPQVQMVAHITGNYDFAVRVMGHTIENLNEFAINFEQIFGDSLEDFHISFINKEYKRHYLAVSEKFKEKVELNAVDKFIIEKKMKNSLIGINELAKTGDFHRNTISKRWKMLWRKGVLIKKIPLLTPRGYKEIDLGLKAVIIIKSAPGKENKLVKVLLHEKEIQDIFTTLSNEIIIVMRTEDSDSLATLHAVLPRRADKLIKKTNTFIILKSLRRPGFLFGSHEF